MKKKLLLSLLLLLPTIGNTAGVPTSFTYQGKALNAAGTAPLTSTVTFTLSITDPSSACILYQETQANVNLSTTNGIFALQVGSAIGATKRTSGVDPGLSMTSVFANNSTQLVSAGGACTSGYTPAANDVRKLHVVITPTAGSPITISPDLTINTVPNSLVAETVQGLTPSQLMNPPATIISYSGPTCPSGYLAADGSSYSVATYPALSTIYKNGSAYIYGGTVAGGSFNVPNASGVFLRGSGSQTIGGNTYTAGAAGSIQEDQMQGHQHAFVNPPSISFYGGSGGTGFTPSGSFNGPNATPSVGNPTSDGTNGSPRTGIETRPVNLAVNYCVKY